MKARRFRCQAIRTRLKSTMLSAVRTVGCSLKDNPVIDYDRRQVFDIPPIAMEVTEHRCEIKACNVCRTVTTAAFPEGVTHKVQYGEQVKSDCAVPEELRACSL